ncbi:MAG: hydrogenase maturation nickel metallochaperone HypA [bacterium]|jgi:hydrogenase nickel incorporation protein HypA/HybF
MHELGITRNIIAIVEEHAQGIPVCRVSLSIGKLSGVLPEAVRFCFESCVPGTVLEGAVLEIEEPSGRLECRDCGKTFEAEQLYHSCPCGSFRHVVVEGDELKIKEMELV